MANSEIKAPENYEDLIRVIHDRFEGMSKTYQRIAEYLTQNPNEVAVRSVNSIATQSGIHASTFVRFAQSLGYRGFKDLQELFQLRLSTAAPGFEARKKVLESELTRHGTGSELDFLRELVVRDIASLQGLLESVGAKDLARAAEMIETADTIYLVGQLRAEPVVSLLRYILTMLGRPCVLLDASGGLSTHMARNMGPNDLLIAVSFRFYATEVVNIVEEAGRAGTKIIAVSDSTLSPLMKPSTILFAVPEHDYTFSRSLAAPMCLVQALMVAVAARVQKDKENPRIPTVTGL
ncbi:MurR/RpiR family transcriptional regulator [Ponticoccus sp. SC2-23]|uniref:MurR/RpiR family transcriptional regulator n=1 Tax=Alexandriicola marinus TaxID=2081710 RepID=UPI000FDB2DB7|nr:MurR/RpiR family transcriptional regulator [Alexandriicola marinus]MBM1222417.1 MurR/RpiR family transcriptional regulator [Ponticoccus sp. SC6-9]MBM1224530.1 MurR/RpiR family transcriptional regulator [Ponticoccus sp. SC6-15]MBM1229690.1 MurR/RpiR family transcriptional regulator [Ponticoccus sp. SC6-38]MBM1233496.1 MurR/RpiR family transcriptional regulator [Ponticoccus sp. SC6-45]MBM1236554.1 MurR/RpiR family transcriptional regulator [Ponticoccus sp. SC6-49]MBM1244598.1 MurR/RpiR famil